MRRAVVRELGPPEILAFEEVPSRPPAPGEARVRIRAGGLNFPDMLMVAGKYQLRPPLPFTPGMEAAGDVVEVGAEVRGFRAGDRVIVKVRFGAFAEEVTAPAANLLHLPDSMDYAEGATLLAAHGTAYHALVERRTLNAGDVLLVHGAAGGVGLAAVDMGKRLGARVIATGSRDDKLAVVKAHGADHVINYASGPFREPVLELTQGRGADVIYDPVGGDVFDQSLRCIAWNGRLLVVGFAGGRIAQLKTNLALLKGCSVIGVRAGQATRNDPTLGPKRTEVLLDWAAKGWIGPHISHRFPLDRLAEAMRVLDRREAVGRVAIIPVKRVDGSLWFLIAFALGSAALCFLIKGPEVFRAAAVHEFGLLLQVVPVMVGAVLLGGCVQALIPQAAVKRFLGEGSGLVGILLATVAGTMVPGGPTTSFPLVLALLAAGADVGVTVAFLTSWSVLGINRVVVWEVPFMGPEFAAVRYVASMPLPIIAGLVARRLPITIRLPKREAKR